KKHTPVGRPPLQFSPAGLEALTAFDWPGNVRELESAILRGIHLSRTNVVEVEELGLPSNIDHRSDSARTTPAGLRPFKATKQEMIDEFERDYLTRLMNQHHGNISQAARTAGKERRDLGKLLRKHGLNRRLFAL